MNPYKTLGLSENATPEQIKAAYRKLAKKHHPDLNPNNKKEAERLFKEINEAHEMIGSPENKAKYDRGEYDNPFQGGGGARPGGAGPGGFRHQRGGPGAQAGGSQYGGFDEDIMESLFGGLGGLGGRGGTGRASLRVPGQDQLFQMEVDFKDAILGAEKTITLPTGKSLVTKIPAGFKSGQKLRFAGQGGPGLNGGPFGDLYVEVAVRPSPLFKRVDDNIEIELPVSLGEAVLGAEVEVPTIEGSVMLRIPAKVNSGSKLRIKGKGVPRSKKERGDQIVTLKLVMPPVMDAELTEFVRQWSAKNPYNPRSDMPRG